MFRSLRRIRTRGPAEEDEPQIPAANPQSSSHLELGRVGETLAADYLVASGFRLVAANFAVPVGRNLRGAVIRAEIDLIAYDEETLCFIEVKTRRSDSFAPPQANVDLRKQRQITRAAGAYRRVLGLSNAAYRFDVVSVVLADQNEETARPRINLLRSFWTEEKFRKRRWVKQRER
jgi:putative endonuclease